MPIEKVVSKAGKIESMDELAKTGYTNCTIYLRAVIKALKEKTLSEAQWLVLNKYFLLGEVNREIPPELIEKLEKTLNGLETTSITLNIEFFSSAKKSVGGILNIAVAEFKKPNRLVRYLLHEATHAFASTDDFTDRGYINNDGSFRLAGLERYEAINNADSYAVFVVLFNNIPLIN